MKFSSSILAKLQLGQTLGIQRLACAGIDLVFLDEGKDVEQIKHMTLDKKQFMETLHFTEQAKTYLDITIWVGKRLETE